MRTSRRDELSCSTARVNRSVSLLRRGESKRAVRRLARIADLHPRSHEREQQREAADDLDDGTAGAVLKLRELPAGDPVLSPASRLALGDPPDRYECGRPKDGDGRKNRPRR